MKLPGVYVEEIPARRSVEAAETVTAFVGLGGSGPADTPVRVGSLGGFQVDFPGRAADDDLCLAVTLFFANGGQQLWIVAASAVPGAATTKTGFHALDAVVGLSLLAIPGLTDPAVQAAAVAYAEARGAFVVLDLPKSVANRAAAETWLAGAAAVRRPSAAAYLPLLPAPAGSPPAASSGAVAGVMIRTETNRGLWKAPAGLEATVLGASGVAATLGNADIDALSLEGVNALRRQPNGDVLIWGARTLASGTAAASDWKYVPVKRMALFIEQSLKQGLPWTVFSPNDAQVWAAVQSQAEVFMSGLFRTGAFQGQTESQACFVRCGAGTMTSDDILNGRLIVEVGFAPLRPAEFVVLRITLMTEVATPAPPPSPPTPPRPVRPIRPRKRRI